jgi:hypothetical protein
MRNSCTVLVRKSKKKRSLRILGIHGCKDIGYGDVNEIHGPQRWVQLQVFFFSSSFFFLTLMNLHIL